ISSGTVLEELLTSNPPAGITILRYASGRITLKNNGSATTADFIALLQQIRYKDLHFEITSGVRIIRIEVFTDCGAVGETHRAYLPIYTQPDAGLDGDTVLCFNSAPIDLRSILSGEPDDNGSWQPPLKSGGNIFDPNLDSAGIYTYIVPDAEPCIGDTSRVQVLIEYPFQLREDTILCYDEVLYIDHPAGLKDWTWSTGSHLNRLPVREPGVYTLEGSWDYCTFTDSVAVGFITCVVCKPYPPNVFSPNDDGLNDDWHIFLNCRWEDYRLEVYDRWGSLVFASDDPETLWDGRVRGRDAHNGVYVWRMFWSGEFLGAPKTWFYEGDVTIVR
ncbi:MAG: gliding motility-associated C-terminal domain-containing protein, partial [Saprospiraceae bacterium]|nr:gliding motility-associated C-terminal domain-containing protein [Saprospiraceae bacterium]